MSAPTITPAGSTSRYDTSTPSRGRWFRRGRHRLSRWSPITVAHRCPACWHEVAQTGRGSINQHFIAGADGVERCGGSDQPFRIAQPFIKWAAA